ncbi:MAG: putative phage tail protein [Candidatus Fimivivens sp.]
MQYVYYLPHCLREVQEFMAIGDAVDIQATVMATRRAQLLADRLMSTATLEVIKRWEVALGLPSNPALTLDERRYAVMARLRMRVLVTLEKLTEQLNDITDEGAVTAMDYDTRTLTVKVALKSQHNYNSVENLLTKLVPANTVIALSLLYNRHSTLANFTHAQLSAYTHAQLRKEVLS